MAETGFLELHEGSDRRRCILSSRARRAASAARSRRPNFLWEEGECAACGKKSPVAKAGFSLMVGAV